MTPNQIIKALQARREALDIPYAELARKAGYSRNVVHRLLTRKARAGYDTPEDPRLSMIVAIAKVLNMTLCVGVVMFRPKLSRHDAETLVRLIKKRRDSDVIVGERLDVKG